MAEAVLANPAKRWASDYELIYILRPNVDPDDAEKVAQRVQEIIAAQSGKLTKVDIWGKRKLAYPIERHTRGIFIYLTFVGFGETVAELERNLRLAEPVIRYQTIVVRKGVDLEGVEIDATEIEFARIEHDEKRSSRGRDAAAVGSATCTSARATPRRLLGDARQDFKGMTDDMLRCRPSTSASSRSAAKVTWSTCAPSSWWRSRSAT